MNEENHWCQSRQEGAGPRRRGALQRAGLPPVAFSDSFEPQRPSATKQKEKDGT